MNNEVPMIYTSKGNLVESTLRPQVIWEVTPTYIKCRLLHWLGDEIVKESAFAFDIRGMDIGSITGTFS